MAAGRISSRNMGLDIGFTTSGPRIAGARTEASSASDGWSVAIVEIGDHDACS
jgi:hypothetical protein